MSSLRPFHLAITVDDLKAAETFYHGLLECPMGRRSERWIDFNLHGHQFVTHLDPQKNVGKVSNPVDGDDVPVPHFGIVLTLEVFERFSSMLLKKEGIEWKIRPRVRFKGQEGEQRTMFFMDPAGNALEFKAFADDNMLFAV